MSFLCLRGVFAGDFFMNMNTFLAMAVHDLRTPVHKIVLAADLLGNEGLPEAKRKEMLAVLQRSSQTLMELVDDLINVTRIQSGSFPVHLEACDLLELVRVVCADHELLASERGQRIEIVEHPSLHNAPLLVHADRARLAQVINNILSNAIRYSPDGSSIRVEVKVLENNEREVSITDEGPGISEADQARLFQAFQRADSVAPHGEKGSGLGLAIAKSLMDLQGGKLGLRSELGKGSCFFVRIPSVPIS